MTMWRFIPIILMVVISNSPAEAAKKSVQDQLLELEPESRAIERCNGRAEGLVVREKRLKGPDSVVASAFDEASYHDNAVIARGAAIRARGVWYHLSYTCHTTPDGLDILQFSYELGEPVPRSEWDTHSLFP
jgi:hypothetical protein